MKKISLTVQIVIAMATGVALGAVFGKDVVFLGVLGKLVIQLIKALAVPLVFLSVADAILRTRIRTTSAFHLVVINLINATIAASLGLLLAHLIKPGAHFDATLLDAAADKDLESKLGGTSIGFDAVVAGFVPSSILQPFIEGNIIGVVVLAILFGIGLKRAAAKDSSGEGIVPRCITELLGLAEQILILLVHLVPLAVLGVTAKTVGEHGFAPFYSLSLYVIAVLLGLVLHPLITYQTWILLTRRVRLRSFWRESRDVVAHAVGTNSSLATLPLTLRALDRLGISKSSSRLGACIGTNLNNDGILLYEAMAVLYVVQIHGIDLSLGREIVIILYCMVAAMGVAGVPEAGVISLSLVLSAVGLPLESLSLLLTVDWVLARARSMTNCLSDMTVSIVLDAWKSDEPEPATPPA